MTTQVTEADDPGRAGNLIRRAPQTPSARLPESIRGKVASFSQALSSRPPSAALAEAKAGAADVGALDDAIADLTRRLQETPENDAVPSSVGHIRALLGWLSDRVEWPKHLSSDPREAARKAEILTDDLQELPLECVAAAIREYPKRNKFWPSATADIFAPAEERRQEMLSLRARLRIMRSAAASPWASGRKVGAVTYSTPDDAERRRRSSQRSDGPSAADLGGVAAGIVAQMGEVD